ncbi:MAG: hypothetical protein AB8B71_17970 [Paracoccaceae bacterium]
MNIALAQSEIAQFLDHQSGAIQKLWADRTLQRSVFVEFRSSPELSHSSIYDVLEYYLRQDVLPANTVDSDVEAWMSAVDEFVETDGYRSDNLEDMVFALMQNYLDFSSQPLAPEDLSRRASLVLFAYLSLLGFVERETQGAAQRGTA